MKLILLPLSPDQLKRLADLLANELPDSEDQKYFLENAGLSSFLSQVNRDTPLHFATSLIRALQSHGTWKDSNEPALKVLLQNLLERVSGREDDRTFLESLLDLCPITQFTSKTLTLQKFAKYSLLLATLIGISVNLGFASYKPSAPKMSSTGFNILFLEFGAKDKDGNPVEFPDSTEISTFFMERLEASIKENFREVSTQFNFEYVTNNELKATTDTQEIAEIIANLQETSKANIVIYGVIHPENQSGMAQFDPIFYTKYGGISQAPDSIDGEVVFGESFFVPLPFDPDTYQTSQNTDFEVRPQLLALFAIGLAFEAKNNYERALEYYHIALTLPGWSNDGVGREIGYLFIGNANIRWASIVPVEGNKYDGLLRSAEENYREALQTKPNYNRALFGLEAVRYLQAVKIINQGVEIDIEKGIALLREAEEYISQALSATNNEDYFIVRTKVHLEYAQIAMILYYVNDRDEAYLDKAQDDLNILVGTYDLADDFNKLRLQRATSDAHGLLGRIALERNLKPPVGDSTDWVQLALDAYASAARLAPPYFKAQYHCIRGQIYSEGLKFDIANEELALAEGIVHFEHLPLPDDCHTLQDILIVGITQQQESNPYFDFENWFYPSHTPVPPTILPPEIHKINGQCGQVTCG